jgi:ribosome recycling factor
MREVPTKRIETELKEIEARIKLIREHLKDDAGNEKSGCNIHRDKIQWSAMEINTKTEKICDIIQGI